MMRRASYCAGHAFTSLTVVGSRRFFQGERCEAEIVKLTKERGMFSDASVEASVHQLMSRLSDSPYVRHYTDAEVSAHAHGFLCAKARSALGEPFEHFHESDDSAFYICRKDQASQLRAVRQLTKFVSRERETKQSVSVRCYTAGDSDIAVFTAKIRPFVNPNPEKGETDIGQLASSAFLEERSPEMQERYQDLINRFHESVVPVHTVREVDGEVCFSMIMAADRSYYIATLQTVIQEIPGAVVTRCFSETFSNDTHVYTYFVRGATSQQLSDRASLVPFLPTRPRSLITRLHEDMVFDTEQTVYTDAAVIRLLLTPQPTSEDYRHLRSLVSKEPNGLSRLNNLRTTLSLEMMSERYILTLISTYPEFMKEIYEDFQVGTTHERRCAIREKITTRFREDQRSEHDLGIFNAFLQFNEVVLKHNFFKQHKVALCFRLDPSFLRSLGYPRVPHGVFLLAGAQWRGFHVRFTDIARGAVRMIFSKDTMYRRNKRSVFQENYNLALTQLLKNKDIPEGGSKGTILVSSRYLNTFNQPLCERIFLQYADALLDVVIPGEEGIVDRLKTPEIIFLGPDEHTAGTFPSVGSLFSKKRGYSAWKSFTTGKDASLGGIPTTILIAMTTRSVRTMVRGVYEKLGLDEASQTKFLTGGPDGDLGSNEILLSKEKTLAVLDISASLFDPEGLNKEELKRLATARKQLRDFDKSKLSSKGFLVLTGDKNVTLPDGTHVSDGVSFRDEFHLTKYSAADVFVPCGGRPRSVTLANVGRFLNLSAADNDSLLAGGSIQLKTPKYKIIVEGANLFISQDARLAIERCGIVLIKDASANKGGVTSSSLEVYAGVALSDEEHAQHMCVKDPNNVPEFYKKYVLDIIERIESNARREFEAIWREQQVQEGMPKTLIADSLSEKNVRVRASILSSDMCENKELVRYVLSNYTPKTLLEVVPLETLMERVPLEYQKAICAMWLASEYVYTTGISGNEFDFFTFMTKHMEQAKHIS
uniref:NAD-specific glutamate dehydrogenase n=1 Tax=Trypanosoma brucei TaxID=5691 RepID=O99877_9TRYP|nr:glutamate dehydrogenase [Trypanosoma brucei]